MDVREKLAKLVHNARMNALWHNAQKPDEYITDMLMQDGVTVQECGHWEDDHGDYVCSCCHTVFADEIVWLVRGESNEPNYCPHCGAKMDGDGNG